MVYVRAFPTSRAETQLETHREVEFKNQILRSGIAVHIDRPVAKVNVVFVANTVPSYAQFSYQSFKKQKRKRDDGDANNARPPSFEKQRLEWSVPIGAPWYV